MAGIRWRAASDVISTRCLIKKLSGVTIRPALGWRASAASTDSIVDLSPTGAATICTPNDAAAVCIGPKKYAPRPGDEFGLNKAVAFVTLGAISFSSSTHLPAIEASRLLKPVTLPPGRARLARKPSPTG